MFNTVYLSYHFIFFDLAHTFTFEKFLNVLLAKSKKITKKLKYQVIIII